MTVTRRRFLRGVGTTAVFLSSSASTAVAASVGSTAQVGEPESRPDVRVVDNRVHVRTKTLTAVIDKGFLTSLKNAATGEEYIRPFNLGEAAAVQLIYLPEEAVRIDESKFGKITVRQVSETSAEFMFHCWDGDAVLTVGVDPVTGDLVMEPSAFSSRPGVRACRWTITGLRPEHRLVAPFFQGIRLPLEDSLVRDTRWPWPMHWEAGFAIIESSQGGFWVRCQDTGYRYKALKVGTADNPLSLGLDTEAYGPVEENLAAGGLAWRINCFKGDWKTPAESYRQWLWNAYQLSAQETRRRTWIYDVTLALSWCPGDPALLDAIRDRIDARHVLLHFPDWRTDGYDENYPTYKVSDKGREFVMKAQEMGFHVMPHFNSVDMDPSHPVYNLIRDFQYRDVVNRRLAGWSWYEGRVIGVPESNEQRLGHRDKKVMVKVHPGLSMWRSVLGQSIDQAAADLNLDTVFIDVTLVSQNLHNCLVENMTSSEGMNRLIDHVSRLRNGLVVGGEGLNEVTAQGLSFAQAHLFRSWQTNTEGLERTGGCPLNELLFGRLCRTIGYSGLSGQNEQERLRMRIHEEHQAIPTLTVDSASEIVNPNPAVKRVLDRALELKR